jgi:predicted transcriptional regulator
LADRGFPGLGDQRIRSNGIAKLRDSDVIIASATKRGYKIPRSRADINDFLELASSQILPLLDRVKKARDVYRLSSVGEYDILEAEQFAQLRKLLLSLEAL